MYIVSLDTVPEKPDSRRHSPVRVRLLLIQTVVVNSPLASSHGLATRGRGQTARLGEHQLGRLDTGLLKVGGQAAGLLALLLGGDDGLGAGLADELDARLGGAADGQESDLIGLVDDREARVGATGVALPVRVVGNVAGREGDGVVVLERRVGAGGGQAVVRVQGHAVGPVRVEGERAADTLPDTFGLEGVLLFKGAKEAC